jgi:hypothetical protein
MEEGEWKMEEGEWKGEDGESILHFPTSNFLSPASVLREELAHRTDDRRIVAELSGVPGVEALVTDDYLAFVVVTRAGLKVRMLPNLAVQLVKRRSLTIERAMDILKAIRLFALV